MHGVVYNHASQLHICVYRSCWHSSNTKLCTFNLLNWCNHASPLHICVYRSCWHSSNTKLCTFNLLNWYTHNQFGSFVSHTKDTHCANDLAPRTSAFALVFPKYTFYVPNPCILGTRPVLHVKMDPVVSLSW